MRVILGCSLLIATPTAAQDAVVTGELTRADFESYREVPFAVPAGVERITVRLSYDKADRTVVDLGLWDPARFRGWSGGTRDRFTVSATDASPGYLAGPLPPGQWKAMLGVPNIRDGVRSRYRVEVYFDRGKARAASAAIADPPLRNGPGWYRGDFHAHDAHSDGSCATRSSDRGNTAATRVPCPLFRTVEAAAAAGLDFIAITNHNTVSHFTGLRELQPWFDRLLLIPGVEVTMFRGHANIFAATRFVDFRLGSRNGIRALQDDVADAGAILSINHPALPSGEACMGCGWSWPGTDWSRVAAIEAINGTIATGPLAGAGFWHARLNEGHRLTGIAGSDSHDPDAPAGRAPIGRPTTVVYARELSTAAILAGVRSGNVFIDVEGSRDRLLEVEARSGGAVATMGGELRADGPIRVSVHAKGVAGGRAAVIVDGQRFGEDVAIATADDRVSLTLPARTARRWLAVVVSLADRPLLIGNPIYIIR